MTCTTKTSRFSGAVVQVLDSLIDGPLELSNVREGNELIGAIVRYLRTGAEPEPRTDAQRMALTMVRPVLEKSRARIVAGREGGSRGGGESKASSRREGKTGSKEASGGSTEMESEVTSKRPSKTQSKRASDIYSSSYTPDSPSKGEGCGEGDEGIPYEAIVARLNGATGASYRHTTRKTRQLIRARWSEGFRLPDFERVVDTMAAAWSGDPKMAQYLRPETLFGPKFEGYLNRPSSPARGGAAGDEYSRL